MFGYCVRDPAQVDQIEILGDNSSPAGSAEFDVCGCHDCEYSKKPEVKQKRNIIRLLQARCRASVQDLFTAVFSQFRNIPSNWEHSTGRKWPQSEKEWYSEDFSFEDSSNW